MPKWYDKARGDLGVKEAPGPRDNPVVLEYYGEAGHPGIKHDSVAWCAAFANAMLQRAGVRGTGSLAARSFLKWGVKLDEPVEGCIVVFKRGNSSWQGHVAFYVSETATHIQCLGGNQSDAVNIRSYRKSKLLGYRWPENEPISAPKRKPETPLLRVGSTGWRVEALQKRLAALGYNIVVDGDFGRKTKSAVMEFQSDNEISIDGIVGPKTQSALDTAKPPPKAARSEDDMEDLKERGSRIVTKASAANTATKWGIGSLLGAEAVNETGVLGVAENAVGAGHRITGVMGSVQDLAQLAVSHWYIIAGGVALYVLWQNWGVKEARLEDHQSGKTT